MTIKQLQNIYQLILAAEIDCDRLSVEEIKDLREAVKDEIYAQQLKDFANHLDFVLPMNDDYPTEEACDQAWDEYYSKSWTIMFDGKVLTVPTDAIVYNHMQDMLKELISNL